VRWSLAPANEDEAIRLLAQRLRLADDIAAASYAVAADPADGLARDGALDMAGFRNVLKLRAAHLGTWGGTPPEPETFIDLSYYRKALAAM
jgi:hypothetical protein